MNNEIFSIVISRSIFRLLNPLSTTDTHHNNFCKRILGGAALKSAGMFRSSFIIYVYNNVYMYIHIRTIELP